MEFKTDKQPPISNVDNLQNPKLETCIKSEIYYNDDEVFNNRYKDNVRVKDENLHEYYNIDVKDELGSNLLRSMLVEDLKSTGKDDTKQTDNNTDSSGNLSNNTLASYSSELQVICIDDSDTDDDSQISLPNKDFNRTGRNICKEDTVYEVCSKRSTIVDHEQVHTGEKSGINHSEQGQNDTYEKHGKKVVYAATSTIPPVPQIPANVDYAGELDFDIRITPNDSAGRTSWIYSQQLNKLYIPMHNVLPVDVKRKVLPDDRDLFLRATLLYRLPQFAGEVIERCSSHVVPSLMNNRDVEPHIIRHVLRCTNSESIYLGDADKKQHLSVITRLEEPQAGMETVRMNYQFMCKNSCPTSMNRRAIEMIFTLEDACGRVLGRRKLNVRICSCPKRDKDKEEKEFKEEYSEVLQKHGLKRKYSKRSTETSNVTDVTSVMNHDRHHTDNLVYGIPFLEVVGIDVAIDTLRFAQDRMLGELERGRYGNDENVHALVKRCIKNINLRMKNLIPK